MIRRIAFLAWALLCFVAAHAAGQGLQAPNRLVVVERVAAACPGLVRQDHAFTDAVATVLNAEDARWGRNGKRGNAGDPSHDAVAFRNPAVPFGVSIVDIIGGAGGPSPSVAWIDQTQATLDARTTGVWVAPSGRLPACLTGGNGGGTEPDPKPPPPDSTAEILAEIRASQRVHVVLLQELSARLAALEAKPGADVLALATLTAYVDDMVGNGPAGDTDRIPNHVTDIKERLDVLRVQLEQLNAWLRSRTILRR